MERIYVGTGGWRCNDPPYNRLRSCAKTFDFVEVNSTFYEDPPLARVREWRRMTPNEFIFTVKCSKVVTHEERLRPTERSLESLVKMVEVCDELKAKVLVLQTPKSMKFNDEEVEGFQDLLDSISLEGMILALDPGGRYPVNPPAKLVKTMGDRKIVHAVDLLKEEPAYLHEVLYLRLFGVKVSDDELKILLKRMESSGSKEVYIGSHYLKMVDPALRLLRMLDRGRQQYL